MSTARQPVMVTFQQLRHFDPELLRRLGMMWSALARQVERRGDQLSRQALDLPKHWEGRAFDAAAAGFRSLLSRIDATYAPLTSIDARLAATADDLLRAQGVLFDALDRAARIPATISDDGEKLSYTGDDVTTHPAHRERIIHRISSVLDDIDAALLMADQADRAAADALSRLVPGYDPADPSRGWTPASQIPGPGEPSRRVHAWWQDLSPAQRQYLIHAYPEEIGNLDGVPVIARDQANRVALVRVREDAEARQQRLEARSRDLESELRAGRGVPALVHLELCQIRRDLDLIHRNLKGIDAIERRLYDPDPDAPRAHLIGFRAASRPGLDGADGTADDGRVIIALGNPDVADHVATYLPGTGADLDSVGKDLERAEIMADDARRVAPTDRTSMIMWLGYDAPDNVPQAASDGHAERAAGDLRRFQDGLRVTHDGSASHNTVIGHSYGSTAIGYAAKAGGIDADELVFLGSPGVGVDHASHLKGVPANHVWATRAELDPIRWVPDLWFGEDPYHDDFGGRRFDSHPGRVLGQLAAHSGYWDGDNPSRRGIAGIITGDYHVVPEDTQSP
ncbi:MAG TPA: alpha/beta hydrolase [Micromonosporaceae bacterium]|nr:alpha/beta hydrolase [Micromonosporaceae bacterium]